MKRLVSYAVALFVTLALVQPMRGDEKTPKPGPMTGTWECMSHGSSRGDMPFTLYLEQSGEQIYGTVSSPMGATDIAAGSYRNKQLELKIVAPQGVYLVSGKLKKKQLVGDWSFSEGEKGTWEGKKTAPARP